MIIILYLSVALIAIAFLILVIFLSRTLRSLQITLDNVAKTLSGLEKQMEGITVETTELLHKTNALATDIQEKTKKLNTVVDAVQDVGVSIQRFNGSIQKVSENVSVQVERNQEKVTQVIQWGNVLIDLWDKWKDKKEVKREDHTVQRSRDYS
ncbi:DUF948 domain-containing protein [Bacillus luteolus]|uniref:DUF948 domain-containing protein n=1 Tax=Litchfieldia luteola TaxID=682179 RepID=A0ABR9QIH8_9BACI|nr:DUF948 domain-containing protein [Cytobacillus luteolus]MBE4908303.1 DUF948 domain-containing protein [Cytobacillus luteolus]MBP1943089.1 uncharacterized protein YoxC [Cytobacillus luteolus]